MHEFICLFYIKGSKPLIFDTSRKNWGTRSGTVFVKKTVRNGMDKGAISSNVLLNSGIVGGR